MAFTGRPSVSLANPQYIIDDTSTDDHLTGTLKPTKKSDDYDHYSLRQGLNMP